MNEDGTGPAAAGITGPAAANRTVPAAAGKTLPAAADKPSNESDAVTADRFTVPVLQVAYDGSRFHGFQLQRDVETVQGAIERALTGLTVSSPARILAAGRTDTGVHATGQVITIPGGTKPPPAALADILARRLGPHIAIVKQGLAANDFHPRHSAVERRYRYVLRLGDGPNPFLDPYSLAVSDELDWEAITDGAAMLEGQHNFISFATVPSEQVRLERELKRCLIHEPTSKNHRIVEFRARAFLRGQIRNMMGALLAMGRHELDTNGLHALLTATEKGIVPVPAPPAGLYLTAVAYRQDGSYSPLRPRVGAEKGLDRYFFA